ncbi:MAG: M14 family zinc carboxypeptidase [Candidatus Bathyarchaeia archaeon]
MQLFITRVSNANPETILYVSPSATRVHVSEIFSVNISIQNVIDLYAFHLFLKYNTTFLDALGVYVYPPFNTGPILPPVISEPNGCIEVSGVIGFPGQGFWGSFPLVNITFKATSFGYSYLRLCDTELWNSMSSPITHVTADGAVEIYIWTGTVHIRGDGGIDPPDAPIITYDNITYAFVGDINGSIVIERSYITLDGAGYTLQGVGAEFGIQSVSAVNVTVQNIKITGFQIALDICQARYWVITNNSITNNGVGIRVYYLSSNNTVIENHIVNNGNGIKISAYAKSNNIVNNTIVDCDIGVVITSFYSEDGYNNVMGNWFINNDCGVFIDKPEHNTFYHNNFVSNAYQVYIYGETENIWDNGSEGNYWSDYNGTDANGDGIGDTPYIINQNNMDNYPLMQPWAPPWGDWKHYHSYNEIVSTLLFLNSSFPKIVEVFSIGKSHQGREIYCIRLTNETNAFLKPEVLFVGYHHAREPISAELPLYFALSAAVGYGANQTITYLINNCEIYIVVALNVDGFDLFNANDWQRKNACPVDEDDDGLFDEDPPEDEDGDGFIEQLINYTDPENPVLIGWEGIDNDGDGLSGEDWIGGVDLNRNYNYAWEQGTSNKRSELYKGSKPFSEPETQAIRDLVQQHNFMYAISFHSGMEMILYPWGCTRNPPPDEARYKEIANELSLASGGTPYMQSSFGAGLVYGIWDDWMYGTKGVFALTCEIFYNETWEGISEPGPYPNTRWEGGIKYWFNPFPNGIEATIQRWLPVFTCITNRTISEFQYRNIAVTGVTVLKSIVGQGFAMNISVKIANYGEFMVTFNVTAFANETSIGTKEVTLEGNSSLSLTFTWNTTSYAKGNYTLWAYAWPVQGETDIEDNILAAPFMVSIVIPGDGNLNGRIEILDVVLVTSRYGAKKGDTNYDPNVDWNSDGKIDILDVVIVTSRYGHAEPYFF